MCIHIIKSSKKTYTVFRNGGNIKQLKKLENVSGKFNNSHSSRKYPKNLKSCGTHSYRPVAGHINIHGWLQAKGVVSLGYGMGSTSGGMADATALRPNLVRCGLTSTAAGQFFSLYNEKGIYYAS